MSNEGEKHLLVQVNPVFFNARFSEYCHDNVATSVEQPGSTSTCLIEKPNTQVKKTSYIFII